MQKKPNEFVLKYNKMKKKHNEKAECINNMTRELKGLEEGPKLEIHIDLLKTTKNIKLKNARIWWNIWVLVQEIHLP